MVHYSPGKLVMSFLYRCNRRFRFTSDRTLLHFVNGWEELSWFLWNRVRSKGTRRVVQDDKLHCPMLHKDAGIVIVT